MLLGKMRKFWYQAFFTRAYILQDIFFGTKVKVICQGQGQISRPHFTKNNNNKNGRYGGVFISFTNTTSFFLTDSVDQRSDCTYVQSDLDLHCPPQILDSSSVV